jgi:hypothetical protein
MATVAATIRADTLTVTRHVDTWVADMSVAAMQAVDMLVVAAMQDTGTPEADEALAAADTAVAAAAIAKRLC